MSNVKVQMPNQIQSSNEMQRLNDLITSGLMTTNELGIGLGFGRYALCSMRDFLKREGDLWQSLK